MKGKYIIIGWVFLFLAGVNILFSIQFPSKRDPSIDMLFDFPSMLTVFSAIGWIVGYNIFSIVALIIGVIHYFKHKNSLGRLVVILSIMFIFLTSIIGFFYNPDNRLDVEPYGFTFISHDSSEYKIVFYKKPQVRKATTLGVQSYIYETGTSGVLPSLKRAEFIPLSDTAAFSSNLEETIKIFSNISGLKTPKIKIETSPLGQKGSYSGTKIINNQEFSVRGVVYVGQVSAIHALEIYPSSVIRELESISPGASDSSFLSSIRFKNKFEGK
ncbi:MAG: hypothetical protein KAS46_05060 [Candidatus Aureabacteria bacterium]|nr:hypothetical protein [Candidatus Auribacterota bacterium]